VGESHFLPIEIRNGAAYLGERPIQLAEPPRHSAAAQYLVVRPEKLKVVDAADGADLNVFAGQVKECVYQGESSLLYVWLADGQPIAIRQPAGSTQRPLPPPGAPITLGLAPADSIVRPANELVRHCRQRRMRHQAQISWRRRGAMRPRSRRRRAPSNGGLEVSLYRGSC